MVIVAAVDRTERAKTVIAEARRLADAFGVPLHVVHALTSADFVEMERTSVSETGKTIPIDEVRAVAKEIADEAVTGTADDVETVGLVGDPADEIIEYAAEQEAGYIVVAPKKQSPVGKAVFGSVAQSIILDAPCPVVSVIPT